MDTSDWLAGTYFETVDEVSPKLRMTARELDVQRQAGAVLPVIVKVAQPGYLPAGIELRSWHGPHILTGNVRADTLEQVGSDPKVVSVEPSRRLSTSGPR